MDWTAMARDWVEHESSMEAAFAPVLEALMGAAALRAGERVLDIGFGTGDSLMAALAAVGPEGQVTGFDVAPPMVERARLRSAGRAEVRLADAAVAPFQAGSADVVISKFGMMFFADPVAALANIRSGVRSGGRIVFACWGSKAENPWFRIPARVAQTRLGAGTKMADGAPGPFAFEDAGRVVGLMTSAGWERARVDTRHLALTPPGSAAEFARVQMQIGPAAQLANEKQASGEDRAALESELAEAFRALDGPEGIRIPAQIHIFHAVAPG